MAGWDVATSQVLMGWRCLRSGCVVVVGVVGTERRGMKGPLWRLRAGGKKGGSGHSCRIQGRRETRTAVADAGMLRVVTGGGMMWVFAVGSKGCLASFPYRSSIDRRMTWDIAVVGGLASYSLTEAWARVSVTAMLRVMVTYCGKSRRLLSVVLVSVASSKNHLWRFVLFDGDGRYSSRGFA